MSDYIKREDAIENIDELYFSDKDDHDRTREAIKRLSAADVRENVRGEWIPHRLISREYIGTILVNVSYDYWFCDTCGYRVEDGQPMYNFCPNCGADMRGE